MHTLHNNSQSILQISLFFTACNHHQAMLNTSQIKTHEQKQQENQQENEPKQHNNNSLIVTSSHQAKHLLISSAELINNGEFSEARRIVSILSSNTSPYGDSTERVIHQFTRALALSLSPQARRTSSVEANAEILQSSYFAFNKITPFLRFMHLTANQAILEAIEGAKMMHILDLDTSHGLQWPPFLQAIADRHNSDDTPFIRITSIGTDHQLLHRTGERLRSFAQSLGLRFQFNSLITRSPNNYASAISNEFELKTGETLAVNCVLFLHKLLQNNTSKHLLELLKTIHSLNPTVMTVAGMETTHNSSNFVKVFDESFRYYTAVFDSLEATFPPTSRERLMVEQIWLAIEINLTFIVGTPETPTRRCESSDMREVDIVELGGFNKLCLSQFSLSQAKMLLRLHYPSEGYQIQMVRDFLLLGWKNKPLFFVSSWH